MTIEQYEKLSASFCTADFGDYTPDIFGNSPYAAPAAYPMQTHPRVLFNSGTAESIRSALTAEESSYAYKRYTELSETEWDGRFVGINSQGHNYEGQLAAVIEAKAFRYAMTGDESYGYDAVYAAKNAILTINVPHTVGDWCRRHSYLMYVVACAYDWCYDLMTEEDKSQIIAGCVNLLGAHFEICCYTGEGNLVPDNQSAIFGHGAEDQLLVDYLAFAIACYNEAPEIYEFVGGRLLNDYTAAQNFLYQSGSHWEGTMYASVRSAAAVVSNLLFNAMSENTLIPFDIEKVITTTTHYIRPDGQPYRIGDTNENKTLDEFQFVWMANCCTYAGNLYKNSYLKSVGYKYTKGFMCFNNMVAGMSAVQFLATNDPGVSHTYEGYVPLTHTTKYPLTNIFAKSKHDDKDSFGIYMTMPENFASSHAHMECGSFQIFYKGALASDSGAYTRWYGPHHMGYNMSTISSNSLLIFNPELKDYINPKRKNMIYSGGQSIDNGADLPDTLEELMKHPALGQCTSLGVANIEKEGRYLYSYMAADMTKAYDAVTVDEVCRYMLAFPTDNAVCPFAFITFDRIASKEASYKKTALIHVQEEPAFTDGGFAIVTNTRGDNHGKMVVQSVGYETDYSAIGGEGREFWVVDHNIPADITLVKDSIAEYGWGRIEITPKNPEKLNRMLTVMYVTDAECADPPVRAADIKSETLTGAEIFGKAVLFPKNDRLISDEAEFTLSDVCECYVTGVCPGRWSVTADGESVCEAEAGEGNNIITFKASGRCKINIIK